MNQPQAKESRTARLLRILDVPADFKDPSLPSEVFSHSQYNSYIICPKAYELKYVTKYATPEYVATSNGSAVHKGIEATLISKKEGKVISMAEMDSVVSRVIDEKAPQILDWTEDQNGEPMDAGKLKDKALRLARGFYRDALPLINPIAIEKGFAKKIGDVPLIGYIDLIDEVPAMQVPGMTAADAAGAPKKRVTVDFKTTRAKWSKEQIRTNTQMTLYAFVEGTPHIRVDQLVDLKGGVSYQRGEGERTPHDADILVDHINEIADLIRRGIFPKTDIGSWACNQKHCSFWAVCRGKKK